MKLGAQLYTVRDFCKTSEDMKASLQKVRDIGYRTVQVSGQGSDISFADIGDWCASLGLEIAATHMAWQRYQDNLDAVISEHKLMKCSYPGVGSMPRDYAGSAEGFARFAKEASAVAEKLEDQGLHFIYHNHAFEFARYGRLTGMDILLRDASDAFQFELDTHWVQCGGGDPSAWIYKVAGRMHVVHFKDMGASAERKPVICEIGEGNLDWDSIIEACLDTGVKYAMVEQDTSTRNPFESLAISYDYLASRGVY